MTQSSTSSGYQVAPVSPSYQRYAIGLLTVIYTLGFLDRQIINILAEHIKIELSLSDTQLGLLTGFAFAVFYTTLGIPVARIAERKNRAVLISICLMLWSVFTLLCGMASNFLQLFLARVGVGIGEAGCNPPATSLITDMVKKERRGLAMSIYTLGNPLGALLGLAFGGVIAGLFGWRTAFIVAGVPGIAVAILALLTLRDPRLKREAGAPREDMPTFWETVRELKSKHTLWWICAGMALLALINYGKVAFYASFFMRNHAGQLEAWAAWSEATMGWTIGPLGLLGLALGIGTGVFGGAGILLSGWLADKLGQKDVRYYMRIPAFGAIVQVPFLIAALLVPSLTMSLALMAVPAMLTTFYAGPSTAMVQSIVQPRSRNTAGATVQLVVNLLGLGVGPVLVGAISDAYTSHLGDSGEAIRWALVTCSVAGVLGGLAYLKGGTRLKAELAS